MNKKYIITHFYFFLFLFLAIFFFFFKSAHADAPPPPPATIKVLYEDREISDSKFYAVVLTCNENSDNMSETLFDLNKDEINPEDKESLTKLDLKIDDPDNKCIWLPRHLTSPGYCEKSDCSFSWILGKFKIALYIPSLNKVYISNTMYRGYEGHYGRNTTRNYKIKLDKKGAAKVEEISHKKSSTNVTDNFFDNMMLSFFITIFLDLVVALTIILIKKYSKRILLGIFIGNVLTIPILWIIVSNNFNFLIPSEIVGMIFYAWLIKKFGGRKMTWKECLIISVCINIVSFLFGPVLLSLY